MSNFDARALAPALIGQVLNWLKRCRLAHANKKGVVISAAGRRGDDDKKTLAPLGKGARGSKETQEPKRALTHVQHYIYPHDPCLWRQRHGCTAAHADLAFPASLETAMET